MTQKLFTGTINKNQNKNQKTLQGILTPEFYGVLVFKNIIENLNFSYRFKRIVYRFKKVGYNVDIIRQTECLVFNQIMVEGFVALLCCTAMALASDTMTALM